MPVMSDPASTKTFELLGTFYLGRKYDLAAEQLTAEPVLYDSRDLVTHAVIVGMTGSGKTGLGITLLEEAAIDGVPVIAIDPKGDLAQPAAHVSQSRADDFRPWVDADEAARQEHDAPTRSPADRPRSGRRASPTGARTARASRKLRDDRRLRDLHARQPRRRADLDPEVVRRAARRPSATTTSGWRKR